MSSNRLLNYLSESDFIDSYNTKISYFNNSIKNIFEEEKIEKNISIISFINKDNKRIIENKKVDTIKDIWFNFLDTNFSKRIIAVYLIIKENILKKNKSLKSIFFVIIIIISIILLYNII
jgi:hypothetical protein